MPDKKALTDYPIHQLLTERWSPYAFQNRPVSQADLCALTEIRISSFEQSLKLLGCGVLDRATVPLRLYQRRFRTGS